MKGWRKRYDAQRFPAPKLTELGEPRFTPTNESDEPKFDLSKPEDCERLLQLLDDEFSKPISGERAGEAIIWPNPVTGTGMYHDWIWTENGVTYIWDRTQKPAKPFPLPKEYW